jgi:hypothetical protein
MNSKLMTSSILFLLLIIPRIEILGQVYSINGYVEDAETGERLIGANIFDSISKNGCNTNSYGYFALKCQDVSVNLIISYIGYKTLRSDFSLSSDTTLKILLNSETYILNEIVVDDRKRLFENTHMSTLTLPISTINKIPMLMGETDILKILHSFPGVKTGTEGTNGLYIRGGGPDQNLILLDGVLVYNPDHLFGFVSIFNSDAIKNVTLITGGFPAQYGGRLSSVVDIRMKEGNNKEFHGEGTLGLISSKISLEGPLKNEKTSYLISVRRSWIDLFTRTVLKNKELPYYFFYDFTTKINHVFSSKSRLYLSVYTGKDYISSLKTTSEFQNAGIKYSSEQKQYYGWGNKTVVLRWNYVFNNRIFSNYSISFSNYKYFDNRLINNSQILQATGAITNYKYKSEFSSGIKDIAFNVDFDYQPFTGHNVKFGFGSIYHTFTPFAHISLIDTSNYNILSNKNIYKQVALEPSLYIEDEMKLLSRLKIEAGFHLSMFLVGNKKYSSFEPRISGRYLLTDRWAFKFAYSKMKQYIHLLTSSRITFPTDLWVPSTDKVNPQMSNQIALGSIFNFNENFELSVETYYKSMKGLIEYSEGSSFLDPGDWESKIEKGGIGRAYGLEFMLKKNSGNTTGWIAYSLSKTERKFDNINSGRWFPYKYDRRHDIDIVVKQKLNDRIDAGLTWEFSSGNLVTLITDVYDSYIIVGPQKDIQYFVNRNNYRLPSYHRLDIGISFHKQKKSINRTWNISVYNAYNHKNAFFVYYGNNDQQGRKDLLVLKKYTLFPILPSITYSIKF